MRSALAGLIAGALLLTVRASSAEEPAETHVESAEVIFVSPTNAHGIATHLVLRIVDDATGDPLRGATVALRSQDEQPITGLVAATRTGVADEDGWVRIRVDDLGWPPDYTGDLLGAFWGYVEAAGRSGLAMVQGRNEEEVRLGPAVDVVVDLRDALDRPVPGAVIGVRSSRTCGHMPDQRISVTDFDGRAVLKDLGLEGFDQDAMGWESWTVADGIESDYHDIEVSRRRRSPQVLRFAPSHPIEGTVLEADGTPAVGLDVGVRGGSHRGPWTKTGAGGHFRLVGAQPFADLRVLDPTHTDDVVRTAPPEGVRALIRLPNVGEKRAVPKTFSLELTLKERGAERKASPYLARAFAVRESDGSTVEAQDLSALPQGSWTIRAGGGVTPYEPAATKVEVREEATSATLELVRRPPLRVVAPPGDPKRVRVTLASENEERVLDEEEVRQGVTAMPTDAPSVLRVTDIETGRVAFFPVPEDPPPAGAPPIALRAPRAVFVRCRLAGPDGPVAGRLRAGARALLDARRFVEDDEEGPVGVEAQAVVPDTGTVELIAVPQERTLRPRVVTVEIGPEAAAKGSLDLGEIRLEPRGDPRLTVLDRAGRPAKVEAFRVIRDGFVREGSPEESAEPGVIDPWIPPLQAGDVVEVETLREDAEANLHLAKPMRIRLEGPGPWVLRAGGSSTAIEFAATDEEGKPLDALLVVDGKAYKGEADAGDDGKKPPFVVTGFEPGPHRVAVAARNRVTHLYRVVLKEGERRVLSPKMREFPAPEKPVPEKK